MSGNGLTYNNFISDKVLPTTNITALSGNNATSSDSAFSTPTPSRIMGGRKSNKKRKGGRKNKSKKEEFDMNVFMLPTVGGTDPEASTEEEPDSETPIGEKEEPQAETEEQSETEEEAETGEQAEEPTEPTEGGKRHSRRNKKCKKGGKKSRRNSKKNSRRRKTKK